MNPDRQMLVEELERELRWVSENIAEGLGGQGMHDKAQRIQDELEKLKEGE